MSRKTSRAVGACTCPSAGNGARADDPSLPPPGVVRGSDGDLPPASPEVAEILARIDWSRCPRFGATRDLAEAAEDLARELYDAACLAESREEEIRAHVVILRRVLASERERAKYAEGLLEAALDTRNDAHAALRAENDALVDERNKAWATNDALHDKVIARDAEIADLRRERDRAVALVEHLYRQVEMYKNRNRR